MLNIKIHTSRIVEWYSNLFFITDNSANTSASLKQTEYFIKFSKWISFVETMKTHIKLRFNAHINF